MVRRIPVMWAIITGILFSVSHHAAASSRLPLPDRVLYLHPLPGAILVSPATSLAFRFKGMHGSVLLQMSGSIMLRGEIHGTYQYRSSLSDDGTTLLLNPVAGLIPGDTVTVHIGSHSASKQTDDVSYAFYVAGASQPPSSIPRHADPCLPEIVEESFRQQSITQENSYRAGADSSLPSDYPSVRVITSTTPSDGNVFMNNWGGTSYLMILKNSGEPLFYRRMPSRARDFKVQPTGMLTYRLGPPYDAFYGMDSTYAVIDTFRAGHGYGTDEHDLQMLPNGHVLVIALDHQVVDMSGIVTGGKTNATVIGNHVQEIDTDGNVVFEWRSWDHYDLSDAVNIDLTASMIDYVHMNAISVDTDGNLVISSRHLSELTKIDRTTGEIMWRLGGKNNQFVFSGSEGPFSWQHDARAIGGNRYTLFDNGNWNSPPVTRALEYELDTVNVGATLVWEYTHQPPLYTWWMGNAQRLPNGNTVIGWADGSLPKLTEVTPTGETVLELDFETPAHCYRVFKFSWEGKASAPYLTAEPGPSGVFLIFPVFGDSSIQKYYIHEGLSPGPSGIIDSSIVPYKQISSLGTGTHYLRISAVDGLGNSTEYSNEAEVFVRNIQPGENMVVNGTFDQGADAWNLGLFDNAIANSIVSDAGEYFIGISDGGPQTWSVQLVQGNIPLVNGKQYSFSFEAYATAPRTIVAKLEQNGGTYPNYSKSSAVYITDVKSRFDIPFTMDHSSDHTARIAFNCGQSNEDVFLDNVSVSEVVQTGIVSRENDVPVESGLSSVFPNPFNPATEIRYTLMDAGYVRLRVLNSVGQIVDVLEEGWRARGDHGIVWDASEHASGVYFAEMTTRNFRAVRKMLLIR